VTSTQGPIIVWLREGDLRLADNAGLVNAANDVLCRAVIPVFIWAPQEQGQWAPGAASRWWLHHSLAALDASLRKLGSRLILRGGTRGSQDALLELAADTAASAVYWNSHTVPQIHGAAQSLPIALDKAGLGKKQSMGLNLLFSPNAVLTKDSKPYQVFTPYYKSALNILSRHLKHCAHRVHGRTACRWISLLCCHCLTGPRISASTGRVAKPER
jgi:deoxyribodipyrimidine photo-lyase